MPLARIQQLLTEAPGAPRRLLFVCPGRYEAGHRVQQVLAQLGVADFRAGFPCVFRSIVAVLDGLAYAQTAADWEDALLREFRAWRTATFNGHRSDETLTVVAVPREFLGPHGTLDNCLEGAVPIRFHLETVESLLKPVLASLSNNYRTGDGSTRLTVHTVGFDAFYQPDVGQSEDLSQFVTLPANTEVYASADFGSRAAVHRVDVDVASLKNQLDRIAQSKGLADDAMVARVLLIKRGLATDADSVRPRKHLKSGDVVKLEFHSRDGMSAHCWCKFGSEAKLRREKSLLSNMRTMSPAIRPFLHADLAFVTLKADYTAALFSVDEGSYYDDVEVLEQWFKTSDTDRLKQSFLLLDKFFDVLHVRPVENDLFSGPRFDTCTHDKYRHLLATRRCEFHGDSSRPPVMRDPDGPWDLVSIRPRDVVRAVEMQLQDRETSRPLLLNWECEDWRWRLWRDGVCEGQRVRLHPSGRVIRQSRRQRHLDNLREHDASLADILARAFEDRLDARTGGIKRPWLPLDLLPVWLHGDFHPRNILMIPKPVATGGSDANSLRGQVIDFADAEMDCLNSTTVPMAYDFATFEVDLKARGLIECWTPKENSSAEITAALDRLRRTERLLWAWCQSVLPESNAPAVERPSGAVPATWRPPASCPSLPIPEYTEVGLWRHLALDRLSRCAHLADHHVRNTDLLSRWTPLLSYAQALFFFSVAYLEYLEPAKETWAAFTCLAAAGAAHDILSREVPFSG